MKQTTVLRGVADSVKVRGWVSDAALHEPPLSVVHAKALYRPFPPVGCDDDRYPFSAAAAVESPCHFPDAVESARLREELAARADRKAARADAAQRRVAELEDRLRRAGGS